MADPNDKQGDVSNSLTAILAALQNGVTAINNVTKTMRTVFPST